MRSPLIAKRSHLIQEAGGHHRVEAAGEALMQRGAAAGGERPGLEGDACQWAHRRALQLRESAAGCETNLQSPLNSLAVVAIDARGRFGIQLLELIVQSRPARARSALVDFAREAPRTPVATAPNL